MKKNQGFWITRVVSFVVCLFILIYMGHHVFSAFGGEPVRTVTAVLTATSESLPVSGIIVRDENTFPLPTGLIELTAGEAERVSKGQTIAISFQNEAARRDSKLAADLAARRDLLRHISGRSGIVTDPSALDEEFRNRAASMLADISSGRLASLPQQSAELKAILFHQAHSYEGASILMPRIEELNEELAALSASVSDTSTAVRTDEPGLFSALTDGLENQLTPEALKGLSVSDFKALNGLRSHPPDDTKGRLVRGWTWRFVCLLPAYEAKTLGRSAAIRTAGGQTYQLTTEYVSPEDGGECAVVFSGDRYIGTVISERRLQGELVYTEYEGVRIPWEGLRYDEEANEHFVYCLLLGRIIRKNVTLYSELERDSYYLAVHFPGVSGALLPGDEIIVAGKDLAEGKILR
jgi:hypothetical protein